MVKSVMKAVNRDIFTIEIWPFFESAGQMRCKCILFIGIDLGLGITC